MGRRDWPVIDRLTVGRRQYLILEKTGVGDRTGFMAFDPHAGPDGDLRAILVLPKSPAAKQHVRVLKRISARNINLPTILEYRVGQRDLLVVLTWVRGADLRSYLKDVRESRRPRPSATEAFRLVRGLAHGLGQLHRRHAIVHGDIKPANLILASDPSRLVMIDFGSAWGVERTTRREDGDGVSKAYASPELQSPTRVADFRSDQFSASVILYELLTLKRPYDGLGGQAGKPEYAEQMKNELISPSRLSPDRRRLPKELWTGIDRVVGKGLAIEADNRYPTCGAWLDDLNRVHAAMQPQPQLTNFNARMTRVVTWLSQRLRHD
jgi:serine/threonine protein kinase